MLFMFDETDILDILSDFLRGLFAFLCEIIYPGIASLYNLFIEMGTLIYTDEFSVIYNKISLIIGIFMVFRLTFWLIETLVNPDSMKDKEKTPVKIIQKVLISVIMLAMTPTIFETAMDIQNKIIKSNIIENIISIDGTPTATVNGKEISTGNYLSAELFTNFYTANTEKKANGDVVEYADDCVNHYVYEDGKKSGLGWSHYEKLLYEGKLENLNNNCLTKRVDKKDNSPYVINFSGLFATAVGGFVFWMILMYCISLGTRFVQLIFLQVIAPVPIMCNLMPGKDNMFSKWIKQCTTTYLDLFIRLVIINFVMLLCRIILGNSDSILTGLSFDNVWIEIFLVLGLLTFAKKAPDLIQELLPKSVTKASGDFGLSLKKRTDSMLGGKLMYNTMKRAPGYAAGGLAGAAVGGVMGAIGGKGVGSRIMGGISGATKGFGTGSKKGSLIKNIGDVKKNQAAQNSKLQQWRIAAGKGEDEANTFGDWASRRSAAFNKSLGFETAYQQRERITTIAKDAHTAYKDLKNSGQEDAFKKNLTTNIYGETLSAAQVQNRKDLAEKAFNEMSKEALKTKPEGRLLLEEKHKKIFLEELKNSKIDELIKKGKTETEAKAETESWMKQNNTGITKNIKDSFNKLSLEETDNLVELVRSDLHAEYESASKAYGDKSKLLGFAMDVKDVADNNQGKINSFTILNSFIEKYGNEFGIGDEQFELEKLKQLYEYAENADKKYNKTEQEQAQHEMERLAKRFDKIKDFMDRVTAANMEPDARKDKADDQFNGK